MKPEASHNSNPVRFDLIDSHDRIGRAQFRRHEPQGIFHVGHPIAALEQGQHAVGWGTLSGRVGSSDSPVDDGRGSLDPLRMRLWKTLSRQVEFEALPYLSVTREVVEVAPGLVIDDFWQVNLRSFVTVVPVLADGRVMTLSGYRHGPRRICMSLPGGFIDPGETAEAAALRELAEEAGLVPSRLIPLGDYVDNGNQRGGHGCYMLALGCQPAPGRQADPTEEGSTALLTAAEVDHALDEGQFAVIHHVAGWCLARRHPAFPAA